MTLAEAIDWICRCDGCDRRSALKQLRDALGDRKLHIKWDKERIRLSPYILYAHRPPEDASFWKQARIRSAKVLDPETENYRTLLILKDDILQLWPDQSIATAAPQSGKGGRHGTGNEVDQGYDKLLRRLGDRLQKMAPMELAKLIAKESSKKLGEPGWAPRTVLGHIQRRRAQH
jgi:hypothetical protein